MKKYSWIVALLMALAMAFIGCGGGSDDDGGGPGGPNGGGGDPVGYTVVADGEAGATTSTKLTFTFEEDVAGLAASNITITKDTGAASRGTLAGSGKAWELDISDVFELAEGDVKVKITKDGIVADEKTVAVHVVTAAGDVSEVAASTAPAHNASTQTLPTGDATTGFVFPGQGAIRYQYPEDADGIDYNDYDFVLVEYEAENVANTVIKQYGTSGDYPKLHGDANFNDSGTLQLDLRYGGGGFAINQWDTVSRNLTIKITKITFIKSTRYNITFDADGGTPVPTSPKYVVLNTDVGPLPAVTKAASVFKGWGKGEATVTETTNVDSSFANATLKANYRAKLTITTAQTVTFSEDNVFPRGTTADKPPIEIIKDSDDVGIGYSVSYTNGWGNSWAYFTFTFTGGANLADFDKVTLKYTGLAGGLTSPLRLWVREVSEVVDGTSNYFGTEGATVFQTATVPTTANNEASVSMNIEGAVAQYDGKTLAFIFAIHGNSGIKFQVTDVAFEQN